jgi:CRP/FNR family transcriptional regulator, cyclic AMP receptor protein
MEKDAIDTGFRMALETNAELLGRVPILEGLSPEQLNAIANKGKKTFFAEGRPIIEAGVKGDTTYLILTGLACVEPEAAAAREAELLEPGTLIGELAMLVETTHSLTVKAKVRVRAMAIARADLYEIMEADPAIAHHFSQKLLERLAALATDLRQMDTRFAMLEFSLAQSMAG